MPRRVVTISVVWAMAAVGACQTERSEDHGAVAPEAYAAVVTSVSDGYQGEEFIRAVGVPPHAKDLLASRGTELAEEVEQPFCPGELRVWFDSARVRTGSSYLVHASVAGAGAVDLDEYQYTVDCLAGRCQVDAVNPVSQAEVSLTVDSIGCR